MTRTHESTACDEAAKNMSQRSTSLCFRSPPAAVSAPPRTPLLRRTRSHLRRSHPRFFCTRAQAPPRPPSRLHAAVSRACFASTIIHPIDLAKVRLQLFSVANPGVPTPSFPTLIGTMIKEGGVGSIYAGLDASLMRQAIYGTARIGLHTHSDIIAEKTGGQVPFWMKTLSGMASGSIAVCIGTPMDVAPCACSPTR